VFPVVEKRVANGNGQERVRVWQFSLRGPGGRRLVRATEHLAELTVLEKLILDGTQVTDTGLEGIASLESLKELHIRRTKVTPHAVARLWEQRPELRVTMLATTNS
jgi:hypothetical protein